MVEGCEHLCYVGRAQSAFRNRIAVGTSPSKAMHSGVKRTQEASNAGRTMAKPWRARDLLATLDTAHSSASSPDASSFP